MKHLAPPLALLALTCAPVLPAQLSGNFTIDPNGSGARNYKSFGAAVYDFWRQGLKGTTTVTVASGTYTESWGLVTINGLSLNYDLTFRAAVKHGVVFRPTTGPAITLDYSVPWGIRGVVFDGFRFTGGLGIDARSYSRAVEVKNCVFETTTGIRAIHTKDWDIHHCRFETLHALRLESYDDVAVHHCDFRIARGSGIDASKATVPMTGRLRIFNNLFTGTTDTNRAVIRLHSGGYGAEIAHNTIRVKAAYDEGVMRIVGVLATPTRVINNVIVGLSSDPLFAVETISPYELQMDGNVYHSSGTSFARNRGGSNPRSWTFQAWRAATGQDRFSFVADPHFKGGTPFDLRLKLTSPALFKGVPAPTYVTDDFDGVSRNAPQTPGAFAGPKSSWTPFGKGCPGSGSFVPKLSKTGDLYMGSVNFSLVLTDALGGTAVPAFLVVGATKTTLPMGGSCVLVASPHIVLPTSMGGYNGPGKGVIVLNVNVPKNPSLRGKQTHLQWVVGDAGGAAGFALSNAATVTLWN